MRKEKLFHLVESGGSITWIVDLVRHLKENNIESVVVSINHNRGMGDVCSENKIEYISLKRNLFLILKLLVAVKIPSTSTRKMLIAHGFMPSLFCIPLRLFAAETIVWHHHQPLYFELSPNLGFIKRHFFRFLNDFALKSADKIVSNSSFTTESLIKKRIPRSRLIEIPLGMNFAKQASSNENFFDLKNLRNQNFILMVGRLSWEKQHSLALLIFKQIIDKGHKLNLLIAGSGPLEYELKARVEELRLTDSVFFLGQTSNVQDLMSRASLVLHTAVTESFGQVLIEALLSQTKVVSTCVGVAVDLRKERLPNFWTFESDLTEEMTATVLKALTLTNNYRTANIELKNIAIKHSQKSAFTLLINNLGLRT